MAISLDQLTEGKIGGAGVFDKLMAVQKAYLDDEFKANRIKGPEYSTVYLGSLQTTMDTALRMLLATEELNLKLQLMAKELEIADVKLQQSNVELQQAQKQLEILEATLPKVQAEAALLGQQKINLEDDLLTNAKQRDKLTQEIVVTTNQAELVAKQTLDVIQKTANGVLEGTVLVAQECKLRAEYDVTILNKDKTISETGLLNQKTLTERAQITGSGVDPDSVIGKQKALFGAQTAGFKRDAENKAARLMIDSWNVRRTTDSGTSANSTNKLDDATVGAVVTAMITGLTAP